MFKKKTNAKLTNNIFLIIVDGDLSEWTSWTTCDVSCGPGERHRFRQCNAPTPTFNGRNCSSLGDTFESQACDGPVKCPGK